MDKIVISEIPSGIWNFHYYFRGSVDRTDKTLDEYLAERNVSWIFGDVKDANLRVYKAENIRNGLVSFRRLKNEYQKSFQDIPYINLNGEAQEYSRFSYLIADPSKTYAVAPGNRFHRLYFPCFWSDPKLELWEDRLDRICWIGRPLPERLRLAREINKMGIGLDIFSRDPWPLPNWKGYAENEVETSRNYKYRIVFENSLKDLYHSEKLFHSIRSGCVTFYIADNNLELPHLEGAYLKFNQYTLEERDQLCDKVVNTMENVMFTDRWEVYSRREFFNLIINYAIKANQ